MQKKIKKMIFIFGIGLFLFVGGIFIRTMKPSFAIQAGSFQPSLPTSTFSTPFNSNTINLLGDALTANGQSSPYTHNFKTPDIGDSTPHYLLMKNYEVPKNGSETFELINDNPTSISDKGIQYILNHGYNKTNTTNTLFTGSLTNKQKYYVTQIALWLYIYEKSTSFNSTYCANGGCNFTASSTSTTTVNSNDIRTLINQAGGYNNYSYLKTIISLVDNAKNYSGATSPVTFDIDQNQQFHYTIDADLKNLITDEIPIDYIGNNFMYYAIEISDTNNYGVYVTDKNGNKLTDTTKLTGTFKIVVPLKSDITTMNLASIQVNLFGYFFKDGAYSYRVTNSTSGSLITTNKTQKYSDILFGDIPYQIVNLSIRLYNFERISKINMANGKELSGATLELTNLDHPEQKQTWVSGTTPYYVHLDNGKYKLCETIAPEGFALNTECIEFTVDDTKIMSVTMKNAPVVPTEDTGLFKQPKTIIFGCVCIFLGLLGYIIGFRMRKQIN